jgi:glycopeptidolipid biosynthesis protein
MKSTEIAALYGSVLGASDVAEDDDFFEIGGSSFTALTLIAQLNTAAGSVVLRMRDVIRARTPRALAYIMETRLEGAEPSGGPR